MKKKVSVLFLSCCLLLLVVCGNRIKLELPDNAIQYTLQWNEELDCYELAYDGKIYRPYCAGDCTKAESVIGYYEESYENYTYMNYVLSYKGQSPDEWLVDACDEAADYVNGCTVGFIWKEVNVTNIPKGIEKETEYEWNN